MIKILLNLLKILTNYDADDPNATILVRLLACHIKFKKRKALKRKYAKNSKRRRTFCM